MPEGSEIKNSAAETSMTKDGDYHQIKIPYKDKEGKPVFSELNYTLFYPKDGGWDSNNGKNYNLKTDENASAAVSKQIIKPVKIEPLKTSKTSQPADNNQVFNLIQEVDGNGEGNYKERMTKIKDFLGKPENQTLKNLKTVDAWLVAEKTDILPVMGSTVGQSCKFASLGKETHDAIVSAYLQNPNKDGEKLRITKDILGKINFSFEENHEKHNVVREGILALKSYNGSLFQNDPFYHIFHQIAHRAPAKKLAYYAMATGAFARTGKQEDFLNVLKQNGVSVDKGSYFDTAREKACGHENETVLPHIQVNDVDKETFTDAIRRHLGRQRAGLSGEKVEHIITQVKSDPNPFAKFWETYGTLIKEFYQVDVKTVVKKIEGKLDPQIKDKTHKFLNKKQAFEEKGNVDGISEFDLAKNAIELHSDIVNKINAPQNKNVDVTQGLLTLDNTIEESLGAVTDEIYSRNMDNYKNGASVNINNENIKLLPLLLKNEASLSSPEQAKELNLIGKSLEKNLANTDGKLSKEQAQKVLTDLTSLNGIILKKEEKIRSFYPDSLQKISEIGKHNANKRQVNEIAEGMIRSSMFFKINRIDSDLRPIIQKMAGTNAWQSISLGNKKGIVIQAKDMRDLELQIAAKEKAGKKPENFVCFVDDLDGDEEPAEGVAAIVTPKVMDTLAHIGIRTRSEDIVFSCLDDSNEYNKLKGQYKPGSFVNISVNKDNTVFTPIDEQEYRQSQTNSISKQVKLPKPDKTTKAPTLSLDEIRFETSGPKAANIVKLHKMGIPVPASLSVPFAVFDQVLNAPENKQIARQYAKTLQVLEKKQETKDQSYVEELKKMKKLTESLKLPDKVEKAILKAVNETIPNTTKYYVTRSSTNGEDLKDFSGAGLYESFPGTTKENLIKNIKGVWASKWNKRAFNARVKAGIPNEDLSVSVLIQPNIEAEHAFVTHTVNPLSKNKDEVFIEMVQGQGEGLVSGKIPGKGFRFIYNKKTGDVTRIHLADKKYKFVPDGKGALKEEKIENYKNDPFAGSKDQWQDKIKEIGKYSVKIEKGYKDVPQDIEGCIDPENKTYIVQTRAIIKKQ